MVRMPLPAVHPGNVLTQGTAEINRSVLQAQLGGSSPQRDLMTLAVTAMAMVATNRHVHREAVTMSWLGFVQGAVSVPLIACLPARLEAEQVTHRLHRDLPAKLSKSTPGMIFFPWLRDKKAVPFPLFSRRGTGTAFHRLNRCVANRWTCGGPGRLAPTTPGPRPSVRSDGQHHREVQLSLQRAEVGQQPGHFAGMVFVDAVQPHQRIQQQQPGLQPFGRFQETPAVRIARRRAARTDRGGSADKHVGRHTADCSDRG